MLIFLLKCIISALTALLLSIIGFVLFKINYKEINSSVWIVGYLVGVINMYIIIKFLSLKGE